MLWNKFGGLNDKTPCIRRDARGFSVDESTIGYRVGGRKPGFCRFLRRQAARRPKKLPIAVSSQMVAVAMSSLVVIILFPLCLES